MGTCLSRCYPETNASTNGFTSSAKGTERTSIRCEYRRIFRGNRSSGEESKKWSSSTPKKQKHSPAEVLQHIRHSIHTDRCLPDLPTDNLIDGNTEADMASFQIGNNSLQRMHHLETIELNNHLKLGLADLKNCKSIELQKNCISSSMVNDDENQKIEALFETYCDPDQDCIFADGIEQFCNDLHLQPDDFRVLLLAWHFEAETMCRFTRKEFCRGFKKLKVDSIQGLRLKIFAGCACKRCTTACMSSTEDETLTKVCAEDDQPLEGHDDNDQLYGRIYPSHEDGSFTTDVTSSHEAFKNLYKWSYRFSLDIETGQRTLPLDMAISMWQLVFSKKLTFFESKLNESDAIQSKLSAGSQEGLVRLPDIPPPPLDDSERVLTSFFQTIKGEPSRITADDRPSQLSPSQIAKDIITHQELLSEKDVILAGLRNASTLVRSWFLFLFSRKGSLRGITKDTWDMFFTFIESVGDDGSGYNDAEAWPSLFDDFIEWLKDKMAN